MTDPQISVVPRYLRLGDLIDRLEREDPAKVVAIGFDCPHSDRGDYARVAFEMRRNVTVTLLSYHLVEIPARNRWRTRKSPRPEAGAVIDLVGTQFCTSKESSQV